MKKNNLNLRKGMRSFLFAGTVSMIIETLLIILLKDNDKLPILDYIGAVILPIATVFWVMAAFTLQRKGKIQVGKSYMCTTVVVNSGIYGVIRHPQFLAFILYSMGFIFISQIWLVGFFGVSSVVFIYLGIKEQDDYLIKKFGENYARYMKRIPRINIFLGLIKVFQNKKKYV